MELLIHAIPLADIRMVSISDAALDLDRPDGSTQGCLHGRFYFTGASSARFSGYVAHVLVFAQGEAKRICILAGEVLIMSEGLAECEWICGVLESAVFQDYEPSLHRRKIGTVARGT